MKPLKGKLALITGGSRGLGRESAMRIAEKGADIVITYLLNEDEAHAAVKQMRGLGVVAEAIQVDLNGSNSLKEFKINFKSILNQFGKEKFDILVNNVGITSELPFGKLTSEELDLQYNTNYKSLVLLTQILEPLLNDGGRIISMGTGLTRVVFSQFIAYAAMKSALQTITTYLAHDLGSRGITVNMVAPGGIDTDFNKKLFQKETGVREYLASNTALGRIGEVQDIGGVTAFLCTDEAAWITGQRIEVSGGMKL